MMAGVLLLIEKMFDRCEEEWIDDREELSIVCAQKYTSTAFLLLMMSS